MPLSFSVRPRAAEFGNSAARMSWPMAQYGCLALLFLFGEETALGELDIAQLRQHGGYAQ